MGLIQRLNNFQPSTVISASQVNAEFNQIINLLSGGSSNFYAFIQFGDSILPVCRLNQVGAGTIFEALKNGSQLFVVQNNGQISSFVPNGTPFAVITSQTKVDNLNADMIAGIHIAGLVRADVAGQFVLGSLKIKKLATGVQDLIINVDNDRTDFFRSSDNASIFSLENMNNSGRVVHFPIATRLQCDLAPVNANDVVRKADLDARSHLLALSWYADTVVAGNVYGSFVCPSAGFNLDTIRVSAAGNASTGSTSFTFDKNGVAGPTVGLLSATPVNTVISTATAYQNLANVDIFTFKCVSVNGHTKITLAVVGSTP